jgi:transcriptional regulator with XRE-family HTH domain
MKTGDVRNVDVVMQIGKAFQWYRIEKQWSEGELATEIIKKGLKKIPYDQILKIEKGEKIPTLPMIMTLCDALDITINELFDQAQIFARRRQALT